MRLPSVIYLLVAFVLAVTLGPRNAHATALTYNIAANEKACFYIWADKPGKKLGFYFAVKYDRILSSH
jgi:hypothetical protein